MKSTKNCHMMAIMTEALTLHTISQSSTNPNSKKRERKEKGGGLVVQCLSILGASLTCKSLGTPRDINTHSRPQKRTHTHTHGPSWSTQAPFVLYSSRLSALASAFSFSSSPSAHTQTHTQSNFLLLLSAERQWSNS